MATATMTALSTSKEVLPGDSTLPADFEARAQEIARKTIIDPNRPETISNIGADHQQASAAISDKLLEHIKVKDTGDAGKLLGVLAGYCKGIDVNKLKPNWRQQAAHTLHIEKWVTVLGGYQSTLDALDVVKAKLEGTVVTLRNDAQSTQIMYEQNLALYQDLQMDIRVCRIKLDEQDALIAKAQPNAQALYDLKMDRDRLDKKAHGLELTAMLRLQFAPKLRITQAGDLALAETMQDSVVNGMSLWKENLAFAVIQMRQKNALEEENAMKDSMNAMLRDSAEATNTQTIGIAKAMQRGPVDMETLRFGQEKLISTIDSVNTIIEEGRKQREADHKELVSMEATLRAKMSR